LNPDRERPVCSGCGDSFCDTRTLNKHLQRFSDHSEKEVKLNMAVCEFCGIEDLSVRIQDHRRLMHQKCDKCSWTGTMAQKDKHKCLFIEDEEMLDLEWEGDLSDLEEEMEYRLNEGEIKFFALILAEGLEDSERIRQFPNTTLLSRLLYDYSQKWNEYARGLAPKPVLSSKGSPPIEKGEDSSDSEDEWSGEDNDDIPNTIEWYEKTMADKDIWEQAYREFEIKDSSTMIVKETVTEKEVNEVRALIQKKRRFNLSWWILK
jgi:hypothetical protein